MWLFQSKLLLNYSDKIEEFWGNFLLNATCLGLLSPFENNGIKRFQRAKEPWKSSFDVMHIEVSVSHYNVGSIRFYSFFAALQPYVRGLKLVIKDTTNSRLCLKP
jgi:hypothetical protein